MIFSRKRQPPQELPLILNNNRLKNVKQHKHLGITFTQNMQWTTHIDNIVSSATTRIHLMKIVKYKWSRNSLLICYTNFIRPLIEYANVVYANLSIQDSNKLENIQNEAMRIIAGAKRLSSNTALLKETGFKTLAKRRKSHKMIVFSKCIHGKLPSLITTECMPTQLQSRITRAASSVTFRIPRCKTSAFIQSFFPSCAKTYNTHDTNFRSATLTKQIAHSKHEIKITRDGYFSLNHRHIQITLAQIRLEFTNLNKHLSAKGCLNSSQCECTEAVETPLHYFLKCKLYNMHRPIMMQTLSKYVNHVSDSTLMHIILEGNGNEFENVEIKTAVSDFINNTGRFIY